MRSLGFRFSGTKIRNEVLRGKPSSEIMRPEILDLILSWEKPFVE